MSDLSVIAYKEAKANRNKQGLLINGDNGLARWRAANAKVANGDKMTNVVVIGSSSVVGFGSNGGQEAGNTTNNAGWLTKGFVGRIRSKLAARYADVGRGFIPHSNYHFWTFTGTWANLNDYGVIGSLAKKSSTAGAKAEIKFNGTSLTLVAVSGSRGAEFTVVIDTGEPQTFTTVGENIGAKEYLIASGLAPGEHKAVITVGAATSPNGVSVIGHYEGKPATAGVRVHSMGVSGSKTSAALGENFLAAEIDIYKPSLTVISYSSNDYNAQTPLDEFKAQTKQLIDRARQYGDVLLFPAGMRSTVHPTPVEEYVKVYRELAEETGVAFYDTHARWKSSFDFAKNTLGVIASDDIHMNDYGHQDLAEALYNVLINY